MIKDWIKEEARGSHVIKSWVHKTTGEFLEIVPTGNTYAVLFNSQKTISRDSTVTQATRKAKRWMKKYSKRFKKQDNKKKGFLEGLGEDLMKI